MRLLIALSNFRFDVDHMPGRVISQKDRQKDRQKTEHTDETKWKQHADRINAKEHNDNADIIHSNLQIIYSDGTNIFASWDKTKKHGVVWTER